MTGTFNNNVLTMSAGRAGLEQVFTPSVAEKLHANGEKLRKALQAASRGTLMKVTGYGSIMCFHFTRSEVQDIKSPNDLYDDNKTLCSIFHLFLLSKGYYIARRGFVALSLALTDSQLDGFVAAVRDFLGQYQTYLSLTPSKSRL
jgi:glutamate-1-semialdehyde 2,1-aminomutase